MVRSVTSALSFDVWSSELPHIEIYGTQGTLSVPNPNTFGGPVRLRRAGESEWTTIALTHGYSTNSRGIGVADMACALHSGRPHRANGEMAAHVVDIMQALLESSREGRHHQIDTMCGRPLPLPLGLAEGQLDV